MGVLLGLGTAVGGFSGRVWPRARKSARPEDAGFFFFCFPLIISLFSSVAGGPPLSSVSCAAFFDLTPSSVEFAPLPPGLDFGDCVWSCFLFVPPNDEKPIAAAISSSSIVRVDLSLAKSGCAYCVVELKVVRCCTHG